MEMGSEMGVQGGEAMVVTPCIPVGNSVAPPPGETINLLINDL